MIQYKDLNLRELRDRCDIDFAHYTYRKGQCSCCYGPMDMAGRYWRGGKVPTRTPNKYSELTFAGKTVMNDDVEYILFKNAYNCGGRVKPQDPIKGCVCVSWNLSAEKLSPVCEALAGQLGSEYLVGIPTAKDNCILIIHQDDKDAIDRYTEATVYGAKAYHFITG